MVAAKTAVAAIVVVRPVVAVTSVIVERAVVATPAIVMASAIVAVMIRVTAGSSVGHACGTASVTVPVVAAVPTVAHAYMMLTRDMRAEMVVTAFVVTPATVVTPTVTAAIRDVEVRASEVKIVAVGIAGIYAEVPVASLPV